jgi:hypothetical protein
MQLPLLAGLHVKTGAAAVPPASAAKVNSRRSPRRRFDACFATCHGRGHHCPSIVPTAAPPASPIAILRPIKIPAAFSPSDPKSTECRIMPTKAEFLPCLAAKG